MNEPDAKVMMFMQFDSDHGYEHHTVAINQSYCDLHGYEFRRLPDHEWDNFPPWWRKVFALRDLMNDPANRSVEYFVWMDADAAVVEHREFPIGKLFRRYPEVVMFSGVEMFPERLVNNVINAGVFAVRNNDVGRKFVEEWTDMYHAAQWCQMDEHERCEKFSHGPWGSWKSMGRWASNVFEQGAMNELMRSDTWKKMTKAFGPHIMTFPQGNPLFIRHMFGQRQQDRTQYFERIRNQIEKK